MTKNKPHITALLTAAGSGTRFGGEVPKQFTPLLGKPMMMWAYDTLKNHPAISSVHVALHPDHEKFSPVTGAIAGGASRQETVFLALQEIARREKPDYILIHDAARPCLTPDLITRTIAALEKNAEAVAPALPVTDTIRRIDDTGARTENRDGLYTIQTPQAFSFDKLLDLHRIYRDAPCTDDAGLVEKAGGKVSFITGEHGNIKITHPHDIAMAEQILSAQRGDIRTGMGYDVHRLGAPNDNRHKLTLGGVDIAFDRVLEGYSDSDVALHAATDAILGAIGDADIGHHFSPKDPRWENAESSQFLKHAAELVAAKGGFIAHIDVTIICEEPRIGPHRERIRNHIAGVLSLPSGRVSVKATTTEGLGFAGRGEGIAAESVATIRLPFTYKESA